MVFSIARAMVEQSATLSKVVQVYKRELVVPSTLSTYRDHVGVLLEARALALRLYR